MAYILPNFSPTLLQSKDNNIFLRDSQPLTSSNSSLKSSSSYLVPQTKVDCPPSGVAQLNRSPDVQENKHKNEQDDFYVNLGLAVRTLREDVPLVFAKDLNYQIYRDDVTFVDPLNTFTGIDKYKLIFWALRFHGKILFREISLEVLRIWQPSQNVILIKWNLKGVPRVPWEAKGDFQGTSRYKLDRNGKIYEHKVDNLAFNFPQALKPAASVLDLVTACPASPNPTFLFGPADVYASSFVELYRAVKETLDHESSSIPQNCFVPCP
ncbi:hypothetical protein LIER_18233 [Lithospermum erythrorhizon]|uniref:Uncharacterized protein n=1 Tax=Lithospermum erythrorhizon TaxID=34254 RepID=A0AAV3QD61_LITER